MNASSTETAWLECEDVIRQFESAWGGKVRPDLTTFLPTDKPYPLRLLVELVHVDLEFRIRAGEDAQVEVYLQRFPELSESSILLDLIASEIRLRSQHVQPPPLAEYERRFPHLRDEVAALFSNADSTALKQTRPFATSASQPIDRPNIAGYELGPELGRGGMGVVYQARQLALDRTVAIKVIRAGIHADADDLARFRTEALAVARLQHANIAQVYDVAENDGRPFLVLEYVAGGGLDRKLTAGPISPEDAARLIESLASAVHYAHERGVIHRDLKPANVLVASDGEPLDVSYDSQPSHSWTHKATLKITDFGLAKLMDSEATRTQTGHLLGTPTYMAPEQAAGRHSDVGPATDVYALGTILYECLIGHPPFQGQSPLDTLALVQQQEPVPPRQMRPKVPRDLETICLKCLEKEPRSRYASAQALADDLGRFMAGKPVYARPVRFWNRGTRWLRRHPAGATAIALSVVLLLAGFTALWLVVEKQAQSDRAITKALQEADMLRNERKWTEALASVQRAEELLEHEYFTSATLRQRIEEQRTDLKLAQAVEKIQLQLGNVAGGRHELQPRRGPEHYERALAAFGLKVGESDVDEVARRIRNRPHVISEQIISALDDWITAIGPDADTKRREWLSAVVARADPDDDWRNRLRQARSRNDLDALKRLANDDGAVRQPVNAVLLLATMLTSQGSMPDAVEYLRRVRQHMPGEFWINSRLAGYCIGLQPPALEDSLRYAVVAQALRPREPGPHFFVGYVMQKLGRTDDAVAAFRRAAELDPEYIAGLVYLGDKFKEKKKWSEAESIFRQALAACPDCAAAHDGLGSALLGQQRIDEAIVIQQEAVRLTPRVAEHHNNLGVIFMAAGKRDEAIAVFRTAIALDPASSSANHNLGYLLTLKGQLDEGIVYLRAALAVQPDFPVAHLNLGRAFKKLERVDDAISSFRDAIRLHPAFSEAHVSLALALEAKEDRVGALAAYHDAIGSDPQNPNAHCFLGLLLLKEGKPAEALTHLKKGHELGSQHAQWDRPSAQWVRDAEEQLSKQQSQPLGK